MKTFSKIIISAICLLIIVAIFFWLVIVDSMVRAEAERQATQRLGLPVTLDGAHLMLFPPGLTLKGIRVTSPGHPSRELLTLKSILIKADPSSLTDLSNNIKRIEKIRLEGLKLNKGALLPSMEPLYIRDVELTGVELETDQSTQILKGMIVDRLSVKGASFPADAPSLAKAPTAKEILVAFGLASGKPIVSKKPVSEKPENGKIGKILHPKKVVKKAAKKALSDLSVKALALYSKKAGSLLDGSLSTGKAILPSVLVKQAELEFVTPVGTLNAVIENATTNQPLFALPTSFLITSTETRVADSFTLNGKLDHVKPNVVSDSLKLLLKGAALRDIQLFKNPAYPIIIEEGNMNLSLSAARKKSNIEASLDADFDKITYRPSETGMQLYIDEPSFAINLSGPIDQPTVGFDKGFEKIIGSLVNSSVLDRLRHTR